MTVVDFITDVLRKATVIGQTKTPSAEQGADALTKLNDLMASLKEDGIDFGYNPKATTAESIELPQGQVMTIKAMLVVAVCGGYGLEVPQVEAGIASSGYQRLLTRAIYASAQESSSAAPSSENNRGSFDITRGY